MQAGSRGDQPGPHSGPRRQESRKDASEEMPSLQSRSVSQSAVLPGSPESDGALPDSPWLKVFTTPHLRTTFVAGQGAKVSCGSSTSHGLLTHRTSGGGGTQGRAPPISLVALLLVSVQLPPSAARTPLPALFLLLEEVGRKADIFWQPKPFLVIQTVCAPLSWAGAAGPTNGGLAAKTARTGPLKKKEAKEGRAERGRQTSDSQSQQRSQQGKGEN